MRPFPAALVALALLGACSGIDTPPEDDYETPPYEPFIGSDTDLSELAGQGAVFALRLLRLLDYEAVRVDGATAWYLNRETSACAEITFEGETVSVAEMLPATECGVSAEPEPPQAQG